MFGYTITQGTIKFKFYKPKKTLLTNATQPWKCHRSELLLDILFQTTHKVVEDFIIDSYYSQLFYYPLITQVISLMHYILSIPCVSILTSIPMRFFTFQYIWLFGRWSISQNIFNMLICILNAWQSTVSLWVIGQSKGHNPELEQAYMAWNTAFSLSALSRVTCQYPNLKSIVEKHLALPNRACILSIKGSEGPGFSRCRLASWSQHKICAHHPSYPLPILLILWGWTLWALCWCRQSSPKMAFEVT